MAKLKLKEETARRIVLETPLGERLSNLTGLVIFFCVAYSILSTLFGGAFSGDVFSLLVMLFMLFVGLRALYSALSTTTVTLDLTARLATRTRALAGLPLQRAELPLDRVRRVVVDWGGPQLAAAREGFWRVSLEPTTGANFVVNVPGTRGEMLALGQKLSAFLNKPLRDDSEAAATAFVQTTAVDSGYAPPITAPTSFGDMLPAPPPDNAPPPNVFVADSPSPEHTRFEQEARGETAEEAVTPVPEITLAAPAPSSPPRRRSFDELKQAVAVDPSDSAAFYLLARAYYARRMFDQAAVAYANAIRLDPLNTAAQNDLGVLYLERGKLKEAEAVLRRALALEPFAAHIRYNLGLLLLRRKRQKEALQEFQRAIENAADEQERRIYAAALQGRPGALLVSKVE